VFTEVLESTLGCLTSKHLHDCFVAVWIAPPDHLDDAITLVDWEPLTKEDGEIAMFGSAAEKKKEEIKATRANSPRPKHEPAQNGP
jgi:hypothetical protein